MLASFIESIDAPSPVPVQTFQVSPAPCDLQVPGCWPGAVSLSRRDICAKRYCGGLRGPLSVRTSQYRPTGPGTVFNGRARAGLPVTGCAPGGPERRPHGPSRPRPGGLRACRRQSARPRRALAAATESPARGPASALRLPASLRYCDHTPPRCRPAGPGPMAARPGRAAAFLTTNEEQLER